MSGRGSEGEEKKKAPRPGLQGQHSSSPRCITEQQLYAYAGVRVGKVNNPVQRAKGSVEAKGINDVLCPGDTGAATGAHITRPEGSENLPRGSNFQPQTPNRDCHWPDTAG